MNNRHATYEQQPLTILSYNIHHGEGMDGVIDLARIAEVIIKSNADIVALQEVDSVTGRSQRKNMMSEIAIMTSMLPVFCQAIKYDGGEYGIGILSKIGPLSVKKIILPGREEPRVMQVVEFLNFRMGNTHLSLTETDALSSIGIITLEAMTDDRLFLLAGNFNFSPNSDSAKALKDAGFTIISDESLPSWPSDSPTDCIDYIAAFNLEKKDVNVLSAQVINENIASDHLPIKCIIQLTNNLNKTEKGTEKEEKKEKERKRVII